VNMRYVSFANHADVSMLQEFEDLPPLMGTHAFCYLYRSAFDAVAFISLLLVLAYGRF
jgi:hypothetical protein